MHVFLYYFMDYGIIFWNDLCMVMIWYKLMEGETPASSESRLFAIERSEMSERCAPSEDGDGGFALNVSMGAE